MNQVIHYVGLDVHKETIAVAIAPQPATEVRRYGIIGGTLEAVDKLLKKLAQENVELRVVYEAGPCGFVLCRHLRRQGIPCDVVSPSLIPKKAADRVKTDRRDAEQLARLYRAPTDLQVLPSDHAGSADVSWKSVYVARAYMIERAPDGPALNWAMIGNSTKRQTSLNSMVSGTKYWFRVSAIGAAGQSAWSDPVPLFAP